MAWGDPNENSRDAAGAHVTRDMVASGAPIKSAKVDLSAAGDGLVVTAVAGRKIRVLSYVLAVGANVSVRWRSGVTDLSGAMPLQQGISCPSGATGFLLETAKGDALLLNLSAAVPVGGHVTYQEV